MYHSIPEVEKIFNPTEEDIKKNKSNSMTKAERSSQIAMTKNLLKTLKKK